MKTVRISIHFKNEKEEPTASTTLSTEVETDSPADLVRDVLAAVRKHAQTKDLQIPLFGNGNVMVSQLPDGVSARGKAAADD